MNANEMRLMLQGLQHEITEKLQETIDSVGGAMQGTVWPMNADDALKNAEELKSGAEEVIEMCNTWKEQRAKYLEITGGK